MPRNRFIKRVRKLERKEIERQEKQIVAIETRLRKQSAEAMEVPLLNENKVRRSTRVEQNRRHKTERRTAATSDGQK